MSRQLQVGTLLPDNIAKTSVRYSIFWTYLDQDHITKSRRKKLRQFSGKLKKYSKVCFCYHLSKTKQTDEEWKIVPSKMKGFRTLGPRLGHKFIVYASARRGFIFVLSLLVKKLKSSWVNNYVCGGEILSQKYHQDGASTVLYTALAVYIVCTVYTV